MAEPELSGKARAVLLVILGSFAIAHIAAVFTESINWDEFALLFRATETLRTGVFQGGGRPGLATIVMLPFADGCTDAVGTILQARLLWCLFAFAYFGGVYMIARKVGASEAHALLAVGLVVSVPVILRTSLQLRTDQPALACGLWGGVLLLGSRERPWRAAVAGVLWGVGFLWSQKLIYAGALAGLMVLGDLFVRRQWTWKREVIRVAALIIGAVAVVLTFKFILSRSFDAPSATGVGVGAGLDTFLYYRNTMGYAAYRGVAQTLIPHVLLIFLMMAATASKVARRGLGRRLVVAWAALALGVAVGLFHAAAFTYFWLTLILFVALAISVAGDQLYARFSPRLARALPIALWAMIVAQGAPAALLLLDDSQDVQRDTYAFLDGNLPASARGFHPESGLVCRADPNPFPTYFSQHIRGRLKGKDAEANIAAFIAEFRDRPVMFLVDSYRMGGFPAPVREFWKTHYVPYHRAVRLLGRRYAGDAGATFDLDIIASGSYRNLGSTLTIDGQRVDAGAVVQIERGVHTVVLLEGTSEGAIVYAVKDPPRLTSEPFYSKASMAEFAGRGPWR